MPQTLTLSPQGAAFIGRFEGYKARPYICPAGKLTIGYGHVIQGAETFVEINQAEALTMLQQDAQREAEPVGRALITPLPLTTYQADALISLAFNCGGGAIRKSTLVRMLNAGLFLNAANEFLKWNKTGEKTSRGLTRRRKAERQLFLTGQYEEA